MRTSHLAGLAGFIGLFTAPGLASAASFDCARAISKVERIVCGDPSLSARDEGLARLYGAALKTRHGGDTRIKQRAWLADLQRCADLACVSDRYNEQIFELFIAAPAGAFGSYDKKRTPGELRTVEVGGGWIVFTINSLWEGHGEGNVNTGESTGAFRVGGASGHYRELSCVLTFTRISPRAWDVKEWDSAERAPYCNRIWGMNVQMTGRYVAR